jgi:hypothetical protein
MRFRKLRIAWSVFWGVACVLLVVLWVRSYSSAESAIWCRSEGCMFWLRSELGEGTFIFEANPQEIRRIGAGWTYMNEEVRRSYRTHKQLWINRQFRWGSPIANRTRITVPFWFLVSICGISSAFAWTLWPKRFRLRTLLIATTLIAVVLGLAVYFNS